MIGRRRVEWLWKQSTGELFLRGSPIVTPFAKGYSGAGSGKNAPDLQCVYDIGPIPRGSYTLGSPTSDPAPCTIPLTPDPVNDMCGRTGFLIHADNVHRPGWASEGCIVIGDPAKRQEIVTSNVKHLIVVQ